LALGKDGIIRKVVDKNMDTGNRFSILKECMAPSTPTSKRKDGTVMESWENPILNAAQYSSYGFDKENVKPKKVKAPGLNPVNKTIDPKEALSLGWHVKGSGPAGDRYNSSPLPKVSDIGLTSVDPDRNSKVESSKGTSGNQAGPGGLRQGNLGLQGTRPLIHQRVISDHVTSEYAKKTQKGGDRNPRAQSTLHKVEEAPTTVDAKKEIGLGKIGFRVARQKRDNQLPSNRREMMIQAMLETLDNGIQKMTKALIDSGSQDNVISKEYVQQQGFTLKKLEYEILPKNADGTINEQGPITHSVDLRMKIGSHSEVITFYVVGLTRKASIFLGHTWLKKHNPEIDWTRNKIKFSRCPNECLVKRSMTWITNKSKETPEEGDTVLLIDMQPAMEVRGIEIRAKFTQAQELAEAENQKKEKMTEEKIPEQYREFVKVFAKESFDALPDQKPWDHAIELKPGSKAVDCKIYPLSSEENKKLDEFLDENLKSGRIQSSKSPMASAFFFVKKKDGSLRPVQDYRKLNEMTIKNRYPLPLISELIDKLKKAKYFTKLDIRWGYNNVRIKEGDEWKAAFRTNRGLFEPLVMFFGLTNSPAMFQNMMNDILKELIDEGKVLVYLDDILIFTKDLDEHRRLVKRVLAKLEEHKLFLKPEKCDFEKTEVEYLGVIISEDSVRMDPVKVKGIMEWPEPKNVKEVQSFLGFVNFYRKFVLGYSEVAKPLTALTGKKDWTWGDDQREAFKKLKDRIAQQVTLMMPNDEAPFILECDASDRAVGSILSQEVNGELRPVAFMSHALSETERNYEVHDRELLAIMIALDEWRHLLIGSKEPVKIWTDHLNLTYFHQPQKLNRRQARWVTELAEYNYTLHHRKGVLNRKADLLSRRAGHPGVEDDNKDVTLLKESHFRNIEFEKESPASEIMDKIKGCSKIDSSVLNALKKELPGWKKEEDVIYYKEKIYVPRDEELREEIIRLHHDTPMAGHSELFTPPVKLRWRTLTYFVVLRTVAQHKGGRGYPATLPELCCCLALPLF
jgi:hypothetical protein